MLYAILGLGALYPLYARRSCRRRCSCGCRCQTPIHTVCTCSRYADVPMTVYRGEGYTAASSLESISESASRIADSLSRCPCRR